MKFITEKEGEKHRERVKDVFVFRPVARYKEGWGKRKIMSKAEKSYTVRTDTETESETRKLFALTRKLSLFAFCNYSSFTWR